jgi:hypothetical protein
VAHHARCVSVGHRRERGRPGAGGDALRLYLVRRRVPGGSYPTLGATLVAETPVDMVVGTSLLVWALATDDAGGA